MLQTTSTQTITKSTKILAGIIFIYTILPFLILCIYNVPLGDDFWYASAFKENGILGTQIKYYNEWSGRYMATFLISTLNPLSYGYINLAFIHPFILISATVLSFKLLITHTIRFFALEVNTFLVFAIMLFFYLNYLPDVGETFYWMAGAYTYQVPVIFLFFYITLVLKILDSKSAIYITMYSLLSILCMFVIIGSNEVSAVYLTTFNIILLILNFKNSVRKLVPISIFLIVTLILFYVSIFADGNFARSVLFEKQSFHFLKASLHATARSVFVLVFWAPTLLLLLLCIPGFSNIKFNVSTKIPLLFKRSKIFAAIIVLFTILSIFIGFFPSIYATNWIPQRAYTPIFVVFIIVFTISVLFLINHFSVLEKLNNTLSKLVATPIFLVILIIALSHNSNVMNAYLDFSSGKAASHHSQVMSAYKTLDSASAPDTIIVNEIKKRPLILPMRWPQKHNELANGQWEHYFNVNAVILE